MTTHNVIAIIVAAGSGERLQGGIPKQYLSLAGVPILRRTVLAFLNHEKIDAVVVVYNPVHEELYSDAVGDVALLSPIAGGKTRQESVLAGLQSIAVYNPKKVLIHDAARPLVGNGIIDNILNALENADAVIPAIPVADTIKRCQNGKIIETLPRDGLYCAQTPQGFDYVEIKALHRAGVDISVVFTDDASVFEYQGKEVCIVPGEKLNFKITTSEDLELAEAFLISKNK